MNPLQFLRKYFEINSKISDDDAELDISERLFDDINECNLDRLYKIMKKFALAESENLLDWTFHSIYITSLTKFGGYLIEPIGNKYQLTFGAEDKSEWIFPHCELVNDCVQQAYEHHKNNLKNEKSN